MEERHHGPPGDHIQAIHDVRDAGVLLAISLSCGVHPVLHLLQGVTDLVVAPVPVDQSSEPDGDSPQVVLEAGVIAPGGSVLVHDDLRAVHVKPDVRLPGVGGVVGANQGPHLLLEAECVRTYPVREANHARLIDLVVVGPGSYVDPQRPDLAVLGVAVLVDLGVRVSVRRPSSPGPVNAGHIEVDVVHHRHLRVVLLDVVIGPVVGAALATLLAGPEAEHHRPPGLEVGERPSGLHYH